MKTILFRLLLVCLGLVVGLVFSEMGARIYDALRDSPEEQRMGIRRVRSCKGCRSVFELDPRHESISSQGLRSPEYAVPKRPESTRILVLGDSVTYGNKVPQHLTFSSLLEKKLSKPAGSVEVLNAGVPGYSAYNELYFYLDRGRQLEADVVVVVFCMNDVVNPQTHWEMFIPSETIPREAFPSLAGDSERTKLAWLDASALFRMVARTLDERRLEREAYELIGGRMRPVYLSPESTPNIRVLLDYESPEWQWLRSIYGRLREAVEEDAARFVLVVVPLAYQLEAGYPYFPQKLFERFCREERILCMDLLPALRRRSTSDFQSSANDWGYDDVWHLSQEGHEVMAHELATFLMDSGVTGGGASENR